MKSFKLALLAAAAVLVVAPATAQRDGPGQSERQGGRDGGSRDGGQRGNMRPTPPQAQVQQAQPRPQPQAAPQQQQQQQPQQRGNWGGGNRFSGQQGERPQWRGNRGQPGDQRAQWAPNRGDQDRGNARPTPPQAISPVQPQDRRQGDRSGNSQWNRNDGQSRGDRDVRNGQNDGRRNDGQWNRDDRNGNDNRDRRWDNDGRRDNDRRWDNNARRDNDGRWDNRGNNGGNWNRGGRGNGRPDLNWRNDQRYDWRGWRNTHRNIFNRGRYNAPYGYSYRSVSRGFFLEPYFYASNYWLSDPYEYRLPPAEWPYRWVRYYDDALLVDTTNGEVVDAIQGFFY